MPDHDGDLRSLCKLTVHQDRNGKTFLRGVRRRLSPREQVAIAEAIDGTDLVFVVLPLDDVTYELHVSRHNLGGRRRATNGADHPAVVTLEGVPRS